MNLQEAINQVPTGAFIVADYHTHGVGAGWDVDLFSQGDVSGINKFGLKYERYVGGYLGGPSGFANFIKAGSLSEADSYDASKREDAQRFIGNIRNKR